MTSIVASATMSSTNVEKEMINEVKLTVRQARNLRSITQAEMAKALKMSIPTYVSKEQNPGNFRMKEAEMFLQVVGLDRDEVVFMPCDTTESRDK